MSKRNKIVERTVTLKSDVVEQKNSDVIYREVVYVGIANDATRVGMVTGNTYTFTKDKYQMPVPTKVDERDYLALVSELGKGCFRRDPSSIFMSKMDWDMEIELAKTANR